MRKIGIFALFLLSACSSTKQEISPLVQKKYYKVIVQDMDSSVVKTSKIVEL